MNLSLFQQRTRKLLVRWPSAGISLVGGNHEAEGEEERKNRAKKRKKGGTVKSPLPGESKKRSPRRERGPLCARGSELFCGVSERLAEGGRRLNVDESRAAGKPSSPSLSREQKLGKFNDYRDESARVSRFLNIYICIYMLFFNLSEE